MKEAITEISNPAVKVGVRFSTNEGGTARAQMLEAFANFVKEHGNAEATAIPDIYEAAIWVGTFTAGHPLKK